MLTLHFDGLFREISPNSKTEHQSGIMCYGWLILRRGIQIAQGHGAYARGSKASSNIAEYLALIEGLDALLDFVKEDEPVCICGDAKSIIEQMRGTAQITAPNIKPLHRRAILLANQFAQIEWNWMPRKNNRLADSLTRKALRQIRRDRQSYQAAVKKLTKAVRSQSDTTCLLQMLDLRLYFNSHPASGSAPGSQLIE